MSEFMNRQPQRQHQTTKTQSSHAAAPKMTGGGGQPAGPLRFAVGALLLLGGILALATIAILARSTSAIQQESELVSEDQYQAVFLDSSDNQVYFGRLNINNANTYELTDIYYVQVETALQPDTGQTQTTGISLAKLGSELHGPDDAMYINRSQVLYWENLGETGEVVCAIRDYQINTLDAPVTRDPGCDDDQAATQQQVQPATVNPQEDSAPSGEAADTTTP